MQIFAMYNLYAHGIYIYGTKNQSISSKVWQVIYIVKIHHMIVITIINLLYLLENLLNWPHFNTDCTEY